MLLENKKMMWLIIILLVLSPCILMSCIASINLIIYLPGLILYFFGAPQTMVSTVTGLCLVGAVMLVLVGLTAYFIWYFTKNKRS